MDWLSKKIALWQIKKYFHIEHQQQVQVKIMGQHSLNCKNLRLRNSVFNSPTSRLHIESLTINTLSINYSKNNEEPLKLCLDGAKLVLVFNSKVQHQYPDMTQQLNQFYQAIKSKDKITKKGFISQQLQQLTKLFKQFIISKISLLIENVDVSLQYTDNKQNYVIGLDLETINIKQRMVIDNEGDGQVEKKEDQIICILKSVNIYLGASSEGEQLEILAFNRQILRKTKKIKKKYILQKEKIQIFYNINKNTVFIKIPQIKFHLNKLIIVQLLKISNFIEFNTSSRPTMRPGEGEQIKKYYNGVQIRLKQGTSLWWNYTLRLIKQKIQQKKKNNILTNQAYKVYIFFILYKYTIGSNSFIDKETLKYQQKKFSSAIMQTYSIVLTRIQMIKNCQEYENQARNFFLFILGSIAVKTIIKNNNLKQITVQKIKSSKIYFNLQNCKSYINKKMQKSNLCITVIIEKSIRLSIVQNKYDFAFLKQGFKALPIHLPIIKQKFLRKYYKLMIEDQKQKDKLILDIQINRIQTEISKTQTRLIIPSILMINQHSQILMKVNSIFFLKQNKIIISKQNVVLVSEKNNLIKLNSIYFNLNKQLFQHLMTIKMLISDSKGVYSQSEEFKQFLKKNLYNKLPVHPYLHTYSDVYTSVDIQKILIVTQTFQNQQFLTIEANSFNYDTSINNEPSKITIDKLSICRSQLANIEAIRHNRIQKLTINKQSVLLQTNKSLFVTFSKKSNNKLYNQSIMDIVVPFILIQISFLDIYHLLLMKKYWDNFFNNEYFFMKSYPIQKLKNIIQLKQNIIIYYNYLNDRIKISSTKVKFQGIQIILYGQNVRQQSHEILTMLIQGIVYQSKVNLLKSSSQITILNIYIENCLNHRTFNHNKLIDIIQQRNQSKQPLVYEYKGSEPTSNLIFYGENESNNPKYNNQHKFYDKFIVMEMSNDFYLNKLRSNTNILLHIKPIFIFHDVDFYQILTRSFAFITKTVNNKFKPANKLDQKLIIEDDTHDILEAKNIIQKLIFICDIEKINLVVLYKQEPVYTFSFLNISIRHEGEPYVSKIQVISQQFYIIDISVNCGIHPIVIYVKPLHCFLTQYSSNILKRKEKRSALLKIIMYSSQIYFLNRKIKELTNFIMSHFNKQPEQKQQPQVNKNKNKTPYFTQESYPFCYKVQFVRPCIALLRSSLSEEQMISDASSIVICNYAQINDDKNAFKDTFFNGLSQKQLINDSFESCIEINQKQIQFYSFIQDRQFQQTEKLSQIRIKIEDFKIYNKSTSHVIGQISLKQSYLKDLKNKTIRQVMFTELIDISLIDKKLIAKMDRILFNFTNDDYRVFIRITQQNFGEAPVSYIKQSPQTAQKMISFQSHYLIDHITITLRQNYQSDKFGEIMIQKLNGVNILYTNGEKQDKINLNSLQYESYDEKNGKIQKIIQKKSQIEELNEIQNLLKKFYTQKQYIFNKSNDPFTYERFKRFFTDKQFKKDEKEDFFDTQAKNFDLKTQISSKETIIGRGKQDKREQGSKNLTKLAKWIGGMCKKCLCCLKNEQTSPKEVQLKLNNKQSLDNIEIPLQLRHDKQWSDQFKLQQSFIEDQSEIINFSSDINVSDYTHMQKRSQSIIMHIRGERNREKKIYMLVQHLNIYYQKSKSIMKLIEFLNKPYAEPEKLSYVRQAKFNNYRPFQYITELSNSSAIIRQQENMHDRSIQIDLKLAYFLQKIGDTINGPGKKTLVTDLLCKLFYNDHKKGKTMALSNLMRLVHIKQSSVSYHHRAPINNQQKLLFMGVDNDNQLQKVIVNIPISHLKSMMEIISNLTTKTAQNKDANIKKHPKGYQKQQQQKFMKKEQYKLLKSEQQKLIQIKQQYQAEKEQQSIIHNEKLKQKNKKQKEKIIQQPKVINTCSNKIFYIPEIVLNIQSKEKNNFMSIFLDDIYLKSINLIKKFHDVTIQQTTVSVKIDYWNLNIGDFEPFMEKAKFIIHQKHLIKNEISNKKIKVISKSEKDIHSHDYKNGLCINLTTAFFHTFKELELKYKLSNQNFQISAQLCLDLTQTDTQVYDFMNNNKVLDGSKVKQKLLIKNFPENLKNFFGRKFQNIDYSLFNKKKGKKNSYFKNKFHVPGINTYLYHSYLQSKSKLKNITYRTPFRITNLAPCKLLLKFKYSDIYHQPEKWHYYLHSHQFYSIPDIIYKQDVLVSINLHKIQHSESMVNQIHTLRKMHSLQEETKNQLILGKYFQKQQKQQEQQSTISVKYLIQANANKLDYHEIGKHKMYQYIFKLSQLQTRWIDKRDYMIKCSTKTFSVLNVKTQCQHVKDKQFQGNKFILYDSLTIIISPIIIFNYTSHTFNLIFCMKTKYKLQPLKHLELNQFEKITKTEDIVVQFIDLVHNELRFFHYEIGTTIKTMLICQTQSVNLKIIKETYNTAFIQIYPDLLVQNETQFQCEILYGNKLSSIGANNTFSLSIEDQKYKNSNKMRLKLRDRFNPNQQFHEIITETQIVDLFTLIIVDNQKNNIKQQLLQKQCCGKMKNPNLSYPRKYKDPKAYKCIQLVARIQQNPNSKLTRNLIINYKYLIVNNIQSELIFYQCGEFKQERRSSYDSNSKNQGVQILRLKSKESGYLYTYDFLPKQFYIKSSYLKDQIESHQFLCDDSIGRSLSLKIRKQNFNLNQNIMLSNIEYHQNYHHIRIDTQQKNYTTSIIFSFIDNKKITYPYYINNTTNYFVKITQNLQTFTIKPKNKVPFSWSNLVNNNHKIEVKIEGQSKIYSLNEKQQFEPIIIKDETNLIKNNNNSKNSSLFKKQKCLVRWRDYNRQSNLIFDMFKQTIYIKDIKMDDSIILSLKDAERVTNSANKICIYFKKYQIFQFYPSYESTREWVQLIRSHLHSNVLDKIYFTIQSSQNSIIFFLHNMNINDQNDVKLQKQQYIIQNFYLSIINSSPIKTQQIILINMQDIQFVRQKTLCQLKQENINIKKFQQVLKIKKLKVNNQLSNALNPVILSQIKKSNYPFLQHKYQKQNLSMNRNVQINQQNQIEHYKSSIFFLDQAQLIVEAALIPEILNYKKNIQNIQFQYLYAMQDENQADSEEKKYIKSSSKQTYIDYMEIKPIKMTISVSFDSNIDKQFEPKLMNFLKLLPTGVQNAVIVIQSFIFHHVFLQQNRLRQTLKQYYIYQMKKQILYNAGSITILAPLKIIKGLGIGFKSILYNPLYEFVNNDQQIQNFTSSIMEGIFTFVIFIFTMVFQFVNGIFRFIALFTFDSNFQSKRQIFRKQIFKSPVDGFSCGAKYISRIFNQYFIKFITWPIEYHKKIPCFGLIIGLILAILQFPLWAIKIFVSIYDFFYVIGLGLINWGYYQQDSMKYRSRPIRTFPHKQLHQYDYLAAKGNQIMRKNLIQQNDNQKIAYISHIEHGQQSKYLLLSNYRILYCSHQLLSFKEIQLYKIQKINIDKIIVNDNQQIMQELTIQIHLNLPNTTKILCYEQKINKYDIKLKDLASLKDFIAVLRQNLINQKIQFELQQTNLIQYQKSLEKDIKT